MRDLVVQAECSTKKVRDWLLALLRYAITLHDADKLAALEIAEEIDKPGSRVDAQLAFNFFRRASTELCSAIADKRNPNRNAILQRHLKRIDDQRLRRAFAAAIEFGETFETVTTANKIRKRGSLDLWEGLRS